jgi:hypothetical protein
MDDRHLYVLPPPRTLSPLLIYDTIQAVPLSPIDWEPDSPLFWSQLELDRFSIEETLFGSTVDLLRPQPAITNQRRYHWVEYESKPEPTRPHNVPPAKKRGLFSAIPTLIAEVEDPKTYSTNVRWLLTGAVSFAAWIAPMGGAIFYRRWKSPDFAWA